MLIEGSVFWLWKQKNLQSAVWQPYKNGTLYNGRICGQRKTSACLMLQGLVSRLGVATYSIQAPIIFVGSSNLCVVSQCHYEHNSFTINKFWMKAAFKLSNCWQYIFELIVWLLGRSSKKHNTFKIPSYWEHSPLLTHACFWCRLWYIWMTEPKTSMHHIIVKNLFLISPHSLLKKDRFSDIPAAYCECWYTQSQMFFQFMSNPNIEPAEVSQFF